MECIENMATTANIAFRLTSVESMECAVILIVRRALAANMFHSLSKATGFHVTCTYNFQKFLTNDAERKE